ncbi:MAG: flagellar assembly protein FliH [Candidatus Dactylopiibacterium carminicum]|uniref:Flagellar assembly protein FliH n=1 Tax=Candidatus Dactylopiibacterium carminicum TaxID=857335 RepID=A0A272EWG8_9RHOO|nr:flagellar assembly protein FliH [Candidatus Dactylopiibacterium carminicum]KAF7599970.1 flagellar assembly protein FliH [Candidatus Dactylopiibacterium carminicum]PAS94449.1 MAG: flagellar assembly protein FliH [Candidatus Dactylopiibacterium carminicum]PAS96391.1 MAG: flagellar assembly protein FliH [Candidatus Dactylopiibacterium carminicum]PAS99973.1 MAG: flagellar assembly protein FliH [Candidatus Dactylopiibacterium carminicum]
MKNMRPHRFPPLSQLAVGLPAAGMAQIQYSHAEAFKEGMDRGYREGHDSGFEQGRQDGLALGRSEGAREGREMARREVQARFESLAQPLDAMLEALQQLQADYQGALRKEVVELVAKVARQVIRSELALQPVQLLTLVDETLATMPPAREGVEVYLNPEELERIRELAPERAARWTLIPDARLEPGECRVSADGHEADAGCRQRLAACIEQVSTQLLPTAEEGQAS